MYFKLTFILYIFYILLIFSSCGSNSTPSENLDFIADEQNESETNQTFESIILPNTFGNDHVYYVGEYPEKFDGSFHYASITKALDAIEDDINLSNIVGTSFNYNDVTLKIQEGTYGAETNETYPIIFPADIKVQGEGNVTINNVDYLNVNSLKDLNDPIVISLISLLATDLEPMIKLGNNTILNSVNISAGYGIGIAVESNNQAILKNSTIRTCKTGMRVQDNAQLTILNSNIQGNSLGLEVSDSANVLIKGTSITENEIGIKTSQYSTLQFTDKNLIVDNIYCGLYDRGIGSDLVLSDQIEWDATIIYDECTNGVSISSDRDRNIIFQRVPDNIVLFSDVPRIELNYPEHRSAITTTTPNIDWTPTPNNIITKVAIFNSLPIVNRYQVVNQEDIVWYWNSAADSIKKLGDLQYSDGVSNSALIKGKGYYYIVVEMNESQTEITAASPVYFFTVNGDY